MNNRRTSTTAVLAVTLGLTAGVLGAGPAAASQASTPQVVASQQATSSETTTCAHFGDLREPVTVGDLRQLVAQLEATGEVTFVGCRRLGLALYYVEYHIDRGTPEGAINNLEGWFKRVASDPQYVPSESAREQLIAAADELIAEIRATL